MNRTTSPSLALSAAVGLAIASSIFASKPAEAFTLSINPQYGSTNMNSAGVIGTGATATLDFNFQQSGNNVLLNLTMANTTNGTAGMKATGSTLVGAAFDLISGVKVSQYTGSGGFTQLWTAASGDSYDTPSLSGNAQLGNGAVKAFGNYGVGVSPVRNSFNGGNPTTGLTAGLPPITVQFLLTSTTGAALDKATVDSLFKAGFTNGTLNAAGRFQQVTGVNGFTSDKVMGGILSEVGGGGGGTTNSAAVPEPTTMLGVMAAGGAILGRKRLQRKQEA